MTDVTLPIGEEFERALNRMDFFRLFRAMTIAHEFDSFGLFEIAGEISEFSFMSAVRLHNWSDARMDLLDETPHREPDAVIAHLFASILPRAFRSSSMEGRHSPLMEDNNAACAVAVPLATPSYKRYGLILLGSRPVPNTQVLACIGYEAAHVLQRYYDVILSLDSMTGLTDREIQIVRWTAEGKTAAEIAVFMGRSEHTVNSYMAAVLRKLGVVNRAQMVATAIRGGLIN